MKKLWQLRKVMLLQQENKTAFFNTSDPLFSYSVDTLLMGLGLLVMGIYLNGIAALYHAVVGVLSAVICEYISFRLVLKKNPLGNMSAFSVGLLISLSVSAACPLWITASASAFAVLVAKLPFGGTRNAPFVPVAAGVCFAQLCFPLSVFTYPASSGGLHPIFNNAEGFVKGTSLIELLESGKAVPLNIFSYTSLLSGKYPGAIGTTCMLAMLGIVLYQLIRRPKRLYSSLGFVLCCAVFAALLPRVNTGRFSSVIMELSAGSLMFVALLVLNDPVTSPKRPFQSVLYGVVAGTLCMLLRYFGKINEPAFFSVLLVNAFWPILSRQTATDQKQSDEKRRRIRKAAKKDKKLSAGKKGRKKVTEVLDDEKENQP